MLVLLIAIACGIFYICIQKTKEPLDTLSNQCPRGCVRATSITGNCKPYKKYKNQMTYSCPSECRTPNINQQPGICSYDRDCASCKTSLIYSNGQPHRPGRAVPASPSSLPNLSPSPSPPPGAPYPLRPISAGLILPSMGGPPSTMISLPANTMGGGKNSSGASSLCPGSTIIIVDQ